MAFSLRRRPAARRDVRQVEPAPPAGDPPDSATGKPQAADAEPQEIVGAAVADAARWSLRVLLIAAVVVGGFYVLGQLWVIVLPALLALLLSTVLWPATRVLRRRMPAAAAAAIALVGGLVPLVVLGTTMAALVSAEADDLSEAVVTGLEDVQEWTTGSPLGLGDDDVGTLIDRGTDQLQDRAQDIAAWTLTGVSAVGSLILTLVLTLVLTFFFLKDGPSFLPWVARWLPDRSSSHVAELAQRIWAVLGGFIRAQAGVGLVDAVAIGVGLVVLGVPLAVPLAVLTFAGAFVPVVGAFVTGLLAVLVALVTEGPTTALIVVALILVVQQLEGNVVSPLLMGHTLALHPAMTILSVTVGGTLWGIAGAFLAVPMLAVATTLARYSRELTHAEEQEPEQAAHDDEESDQASQSPA